MTDKLDVFPIREIELHIAGKDCWCIPEIEHGAYGDVIHHQSSTIVAGSETENEQREG